MATCSGASAGWQSPVPSALNNTSEKNPMKHTETHPADDQILAYLERGEKLPARVSNAMLLLALRAERAARGREQADLRARLDTLTELLQGPARQPGGLLRRVEALERAARAAHAVLWPLALAFLGAAGGWLFGALVE